MNSDFERFRVESAEERVALLNLVSAGLADAANKRDGIATGIRSQDAP
ncbi:MAG: hypothetical protein IH940_03105 [Acidobacteria bacterium]|nr:hypothetical protein [Acidobacteriota bacterium]